MRDNRLQFAVMREDPAVEAEVIRRTGAREALLVASGGCTALSLQALFPELRLRLVDPNPAQLAHVQTKVDTLHLTRGDARARARAFNVGDADPDGLNAKGNFESLFRGLGGFLREFVLPADTLEALLTRPPGAAPLRERVFANPYWRVAFELFFHDALLETMFGPAAVQHAVPGSYPAYFRGVFERGWSAPDARDNPYLHHALLGCYLQNERALPPYLALPVPAQHRFDYTEGTLDAVDDLGRFDVLSLSNVFDWSDRPAIESLTTRLRREARPGAVVIYRQLNHETDLQGLFAPEFTFDLDFAAQQLAADRSLFYAGFSVGRRR